MRFTRAVCSIAFADDSDRSGLSYRKQRKPELAVLKRFDTTAADNPIQAALV